MLLTRAARPKESTTMPKADFTLWKRENLEAFARQAADENKTLRDDLKLALEAWRKSLLTPPPGDVSSGTPNT